MVFPVGQILSVWRDISAKRESLALNLYAVHVNHMLRGDEAKRDEEFVREFCRQWNIPLHIEYRDIKKKVVRKSVQRKRQETCPI